MAIKVRVSIRESGPVLVVEHSPSYSEDGQRAGTYEFATRENEDGGHELADPKGFAERLLDLAGNGLVHRPEMLARELASIVDIPMGGGPVAEDAGVDDDGY